LGFAAHQYSETQRTIYGGLSLIDRLYDLLSREGTTRQEEPSFGARH